MRNEKKVRELKLVPYLTTSRACYNLVKPDGKDINEECFTNSCYKCYCDNTERHVKLIMKGNSFSCSVCSHNKKLLGKHIEGLGCKDCQEVLKEYIKTDFKDIFNNIKRRDKNV